MISARHNHYSPNPNGHRPTSGFRILTASQVSYRLVAYIVHPDLDGSFRVVHKGRVWKYREVEGFLYPAITSISRDILTTLRAWKVVRPGNTHDQYSGPDGIAWRLHTLVRAAKCATQEWTTGWQGRQRGGFTRLVIAAHYKPGIASSLLGGHHQCRNSRYFLRKCRPTLEPEP